MIESEQRAHAGSFGSWGSQPRTIVDAALVGAAAAVLTGVVAAVAAVVRVVGWVAEMIVVGVVALVVIVVFAYVLSHP